MNNDNHAVANLLLISGIFYVFYLSYKKPRISLKECVYYLVGLSLLYLFYVRFSIYCQEDFDIFGADLTAFDSNNKASLDIFYKEKEVGLANKFSKSKSSCGRQYSLFGPNQLIPTKFENKIVINNYMSLKNIFKNQDNIKCHLKHNDNYLNFLIHTDNNINLFLDNTPIDNNLDPEPEPEPEPLSIKRSIYDVPFPQKWSIEIEDINEVDNTCLVTISSFSPSGRRPRYFLSVIDNKLSMSPIQGGYTTKWEMLLIIPKSGESCFCTKCCAEESCSYNVTTPEMRISNNEKDCLKASGTWKPDNCVPTIDLSNCNFILKSASNSEFLIASGYKNTNNKEIVSLNKEDNNLFNNMNFSIELINIK